MHFISQICIVLSVSILLSNAASFTGDCELKGLSGSWLMGYYFKVPINDTHRGYVTSIETENVKSMEVKNKKYLDAYMTNSEIVIFTTEAFNNFEEEAQGSYETSIKIELKMECKKGTEDTTIYQKVIDINNHDPTFSQQVYEYTFGMTVFKNFELTEFLPITASDGDFTNHKVDFAIKEHSNNFIISNKYGNPKNHPAVLKAKTNLTAPFKEEFEIIAMDEGKPQINKTAKVIVIVEDFRIKDESNKIPSFSKKLYYGKYTEDHKIQMDDIITFTSISEDVTILQSDFTNNIKIEYDIQINQVRVDVIEPLIGDVLNSKFITIQVDTHFKEPNAKDHAILIIFMPILKNIAANNGEQNYCFFNISTSFDTFNMIPTLIYLVIIIVFAFCSMILVLIYHKKQITKTAIASEIPPYIMNEKGII